MRIPISNESFRAYNKKSKNLKKSLFRLDVWGTNPSRGRWISEASLVYRGVTKQLGATEALTQPPPPPLPQNHQITLTAGNNENKIKPITKFTN